MIEKIITKVIINWLYKFYFSKTNERKMITCTFMVDVKKLIAIVVVYFCEMK